MKIVLKIIASLLLLFNSTGAIYGGLNLIMHPDGGSLQLSPEHLQYSPFTDYLIPGIILFAANGLFVFGVLLINHKFFPMLIMAQGTILTGWIVIQVLMVHMTYYLHIVLGTVGLLLILCGWILSGIQEKKIIIK